MDIRQPCPKRHRYAQNPRNNSINIHPIVASLYTILILYVTIFSLLPSYHTSKNTVLFSKLFATSAQACLNFSLHS